MQHPVYYHLYRYHASEERMEAALYDLTIKIAAHGKMIEFLHELVDLGYEDSDNYLEHQIHKLNCVYAQLQVERLDLLENPRDTLS